LVIRTLLLDKDNPDREVFAGGAGVETFAAAAWLGDNSFQQNENEWLDTDRACSSYLHSSGVLIALVSQEGSRCA
jgi:hypothetical protein